MTEALEKRINMERPLISIIVPMYNAALFIEDTINTVINQTYTNWELIIVDDKSLDDSVRIVEKYLSSKIKLYKNDKNIGVGLTRNVGIEKSHGSYICFLDADDLWDPYKLAKQLKFMNDNDYVFTYTGYVFSNSLGEPLGKKIYVPDRCSYKDYLKTTIIWTSTVMIDMNYFSKADIYMPSLRRGEDGATWLRLLGKIPYAYGLNEILSRYRRTGHSLSSNKFKSVLRVWNLYYKNENLGFLKGLYYFLHYCVNAVRKRL